MSAYNTIVVADRQSLMDIALQEYGTVEGIQFLLEDNAEVIAFIHDVPAPGTELLIRAELPKITPTNRAIVSEYVSKKTKVVSGVDAVEHPATTYYQDNYFEPIYIL